MNERTYRISGKIINSKSRVGIQGLCIEAWDKDFIFNDRLGSTVSDGTGNFSIGFNKSYFSDLFLERYPDIFFKIYQNGKLAYTSRNSILWNVRESEINIDIEVDIQPDDTHPDPETKPRVYGIVRNELGEPLVDSLVKAFHVLNSQDETLNRPLGETRSDQNGRYQINFSENDSVLNLVVHVYDQNGVKIGQSRQVNNAGQVTELNIDINGGHYRVYGVVLNGNNQPVQHITVQAFERDMRKQQLLGTVETDANGSYRIDYKLADFQLGDVPSSRSPWLIVEARETPAGSLLTKQEIRRAEPVQYVELRLASAVVSEWQRVSETIAPLLKRQSTSSAGADIEPFDLNATDIEFIVQETNLDRVIVEAWVASSQMVQEGVLRLTDEYPNQQTTLRDNGWSFFYGLARQGLSQNITAVLREPASNWQRIWRTALSANRVPLLDEEQLKLLIAALELLQGLQQIDPAHSDSSDFPQVLANLLVPPLPREVALAILAIFRKYGLDADSFLALLESYPESADQIKAFIRAVRIYQLTAGHDGFFNILNTSLDVESDSIERLAEKPTEEWISLAAEASVSPGFALQIQAKTEMLYPLVAIRARLDAQALQLPEEVTTLIVEQGAIAESALRGTMSVTESSAPALVTLRNMGRFVRTGINMEMTGVLTNRESEIASPAVAIRYGRDYMREQMVSKFSETVVTEVVAYFFGYVQPLVNSANNFLVGLYINSGFNFVEWANDNTLPPIEEHKDIPGLSDLFGDLDECMCKPCESMLGQPAYLVDLLNSLKKCPPAFDELKTRRADILELPLSCEKTETIEQHINLVLEIILEGELTKLGHDPYQYAASVFFTWNLPFESSYVETKAYLAKLGVSHLDLLLRLDLLLLLSNPVPKPLTPEKLEQLKAKMLKQLTAETLNLTVDQNVSDWQLITVPRTGDELWKAYDFPANQLSDPASGENLQNKPVTEVLNRVSVLLDRTGLTLEELELVLATNFVGNKALLHRNQCKTSVMRLPANTESQLEAILDPLHRFVRLHTKLYTTISESSIAQLDQAIGLNAKILDEAALNKIALLKRLSDHHELPLELLLGLPNSVTNLLRSLGLSVQQFAMLRKMTDIDLASQSFDESKLEQFCKTVERIRESGLSIDQTAAALLPTDKLAELGQERLPSLKSKEQIETLLTSLQQRLRAVSAVRSDVVIVSQAAEALTNIFDTATATKVFEAIKSAGAKDASVRTPDAALITILCGNGNVTHNLGDWFPVLSVALATEILTVSTAIKDDDTDERFSKLLEGVAERRRERELITAIAEQSGFTESDVTLLLGDRLLLASPDKKAFELFLNVSFWDQNATTPITAADLSLLYNWLDRLYRLVGLSTALGLDSEFMQLADRVVVGTNKGILWHKILATSMAALGDDWQALLDLIWLQRPEQLSRTTLLELLDKLEPVSTQALTNETLLRPLATRLGMTDEQTLKIAKQATSVTNADDLCAPSSLRKAFELLLLARHLGATDLQLEQLANLDDNTTAASTAKSLLQTKIGEQDWQTELKKIEDPLRQQRRDALVACLVHDKCWRDVNELYEYYLIDPQVEPCLETTRILEAITATQLFIQRVLFGLEKNLTFSQEQREALDVIKQRWTWMRNYRVWEANRKVFLFPENWLYPELRDDKSSSFKQLESALGQGELTQELAKQSFSQFLDDVAQMGQVQVLGMYEDVKRDSPVQVDVREMSKMPVRLIHEDTVSNQAGAVQKRDLYMIGRTINPPYTYFWRRCTNFSVDFTEWSPWQRIEFDINGDHVLIFLLNQDIYIAWPQFKHPGDESDHQWEIRLSWCRLQGNKWTRIETSRVSRIAVANPFQDERDGFAFRCSTQNGVAQIACYARFSSSDMSANPPDTSSQLSSYRDNIHPGRIWGVPLVSCDYWKYTVAGVFYSAYPAYPAYPELLDPFYQAEASLLIEWECWVKAKDESDRLGYVKLKPNPSKYKVFLYTTSHYVLTANTAQPIHGVELGKKLQIWLEPTYPFVPIPGIEFSVQFEFDTPAKTTSSKPQSVSATPIGWSNSVLLKFIVEFSKEDAPTLAELGIEVSKTFNPVGIFSLFGNTGQVSWQESTKALAVLEDCIPYMNGYQEDGKAKPLILKGGTPSVDLNPFISPNPTDDQYRNFTNYQYWVVGAASAGAKTPDIWHYREGEGACFIDTHRPDDTMGYRSFKAYSASYVEAAEYRLAWQSDESLFTDSYQVGNFGAKQLPALNSSGDLYFWQKQSDGDLTFDARMPYACYNWEVFFHAPLLIADQLSKQHKFEDAEWWLRRVFDPTSVGDSSDPKRFLKFRVFKELDLHKQVINDLTVLAQVASGLGDAKADDAVQNLINRWRDMPFRPFLIARSRHIAFLWRTLFAYLDNLIAWADSLYRRDTRESINEATMLYVLAQHILGRRPQQHQGNSKRAAASYTALSSKYKGDDFANFWVDVGTHFQNYTFLPNKDTANNDPNPDNGMLYFCMPYNDKLSTYWNLIEERLFNVRHCRNIEGITRDLPLTDAPIDPELLIRATAAGLDLGQVISGLYAPPPHYRYNILAARATELTNEAKALAAAMLSAIEKRDAEQLAQLRSSNEVSLLRLVKEVRTLQINEANKNIDALRTSRASVSTRYNQYQRLLGNKGAKAPKEQDSVGEESMLGRVGEGSSELSNLGLIDAENQQIEQLELALMWTLVGGVTKGVAAATHTAAGVAYDFSLVSESTAKKLTAIASGVSTVGDMFDLVSRQYQHNANRQSIVGSHLRRRDEWAFQSNQALKELKQIDKQILANDIRIQITRKELDNHIEQIEQTKAVDEVMRNKFSNKELYQWMITQLSGLYFNAYRMALEMARRAERAAERELGVKALNVLRNDYWDSLRSGLLAGERLHQDIKRLEIAYLDQNRREYELTKYISLRRLDPEALVALRIGNCSCEFEIPEWLFDLDTPGHYLRRIKSVSVSIPCVVGPYTSVNCKLTLLKSHIRHDKTSTDYPRKIGDDPRFTDYFGASEAIVTSTANADSGLFETQLRDERFLPFEGSGVISRWRLELPSTYPQFDYSTISDVVLSIRYTARDGGDSLRDKAAGSITTLLNLSSPAILPAQEPLRFHVLLSCRSDFPTQWALAKTGEDLEIPITRDLLPYWITAVGTADKPKLVVREILVLTESGFKKISDSEIAKLDNKGIGVVNLGKLVADSTDKIVLLSITAKRDWVCYPVAMF